MQKFVKKEFDNSWRKMVSNLVLVLLLLGVIVIVSLLMKFKSELIEQGLILQS